MNLYAATEQVDRVSMVVDQWIDEHQEELAANGGVIPDELAKLQDAAFAEMENSLEWYHKSLLEMDVARAGVNMEITRLTNIRDGITNKIDRRERLLRDWMIRQEKDVLKFPLGELALKYNPPKVIAPLWSQLELGRLWASPEYDWAVTRQDPSYSLAKNKIKDQIKLNEQIAGMAKAGDVDPELLAQMKPIPEGIKLERDLVLKKK